MSGTADGGSERGTPPVGGGTSALSGDAVLAEVSGIIAELVGRDAVAPDESFFRLGGHSLLLMTLLARVRGRFGRAVLPRDFMTHPSAAGLTGLIIGPDPRDGPPAG